MSYDETHRLREQLGDRVELSDSQGSEESFYIITEILLEGNHYCVLKRTRDKKDDEEYLFKVEHDASDSKIVPIEDEDEWETVSEAYDDWVFEQESK